MKLAIKGHPTRGNEVIALLEMLGGNNIFNLTGTKERWYIVSDSIIKHSVYLFDEQGFTLEEFLKKFPYKIGDKVSSKYLKNYSIEKMEWINTANKVIYKLQGRGWYSVEELQPYKEETMDGKYNVEEYLKVWEKTEKGLEVVVNDNFELKEDNGKFYIIKKQAQYPKTFEECCEVLGCKANHFFTNFSYNGCDVKISDYEYKIDDLLKNFRKLRYCRDVYWKIAGEQMGLGKPWKSDWNSGDQERYGIIKFDDNGYQYAESTSFAFPTEEMRDAFYENFKELIEYCKEFL